MWPETLLLSPYVAIASGIVLGIAVGVMCWARRSPWQARRAMSGSASRSRRSPAAVLRDWWSAIVGVRSAKAGVVVHDPDGSKPHDLDDPFFDKDVRDRVGATIADAARRK